MHFLWKLQGDIKQQNKRVSKKNKEDKSKEQRN